MSHKIIVEFGSSFENDSVVPIPLGRLMLGDTIGRLIFCPDGKMKMIINETAVKSGHLLIFPEMNTTGLFI